MNQKDLIDAVAASADMSKAQAKRAVNATLDAITDTLADHQDVRLKDFGTFSVKQRAGRTITGPIGGGKVIEPYHAPVFKPAKALKEGVR